MKLENLNADRATPVLIRDTERTSADGPTDSAGTQTAHQSVITGDCLEVMRTLPDRSIDAVVTSPPYNVGMSYRSYDDRRPREEYLTQMGDIAAEIARLLADDGALFLNLGATGPDLWIAQDVAARFRKHLVLQNRITQIKSIAVDGVTRGHQRPINSNRFITRTNEEIFHLTRSGAVPVDRLAIGVPYTDKTNLKRWKHAGADLRCGGNTWFIPYETVRNAAGKYHHPAAFPVELPSRCLRLHGRPGTVLDPFARSGSTLVAAAELGWRAICVEIDEDYASIARERINEALLD